MISLTDIATPVLDDHVYENPTKLIKTLDDMKIWEKSEAYYEYVGFILAINEAVKGLSNSKGSESCTEAVLKVVSLLDKLDKKIDETPPIKQPQRFGNMAFRTWYQNLRDDSLVLLQEVLPVESYNAITEIVIYLVDSFGNSTRIDYGTGHEIAFVMFLCCLFKIGFLKNADKASTGCKIFPKYLEVVRKLQQTYRMEPAGSHGVWSLDDFQFVPFIWGSSQLFAHPTIEPSGFLNHNILNEYCDDYMFLSCIRYINEVKTGPFAEHSNQLWSISGVPSWSKINGGLVKMYKAEVLSKFPVVQHIVFGSLFTLKAVEQCTGLMNVKTSMTAPPVPFPKDSKASFATKESTSVASLKKAESGGVVIDTTSSATLPSQRSSDENMSGMSFKNQDSKPSLKSGASPSDTSSKPSEQGSVQDSAKSSERSEDRHTVELFKGENNDTRFSQRISFIPGQHNEGSQ